MKMNLSFLDSTREKNVMNKKILIYLGFKYYLRLFVNSFVLSYNLSNKKKILIKVKKKIFLVKKKLRLFIRLISKAFLRLTRFCKSTIRNKFYLNHFKYKKIIFFLKKVFIYKKKLFIMFSNIIKLFKNIKYMSFMNYRLGKRNNLLLTGFKKKMNSKHMIKFNLNQISFLNNNHKLYFLNIKHFNLSNNPLLS